MAIPQIISADDHIDMHTLPPRLWLDRIDARWRDRAPRVAETPEGRFWEAAGANLGPSGRHPSIENLLAGPQDDGFRPSNPKLRLQDMDKDGVHCQVIYGPLRFPMQDAELKAAMLRALNDWMAEFSSAAPDRLCPLAYLPPHDPLAAASELRRAARLGLKGGLLHYFEWIGGGFNATFVQKWDPLWAAAGELGMPISFHLGGGTHTFSRNEPRTWVQQGYAACVPCQLDEALVVMVLSGALERHPNMKLVLGESGIGWIKYVVERMDRTMETHGWSKLDIKPQKKPSETFVSQVYATFEVDNTGLDAMPFGLGNFMWASDYPHPNGTFPHSRRAVEDMTARLPAQHARKLTCENAARLYQIKGVAA